MDALSAAFSADRTTIESPRFPPRTRVRTRVNSGNPTLATPQNLLSCFAYLFTGQRKLCNMKPACNLLSCFALPIYRTAPTSQHGAGLQPRQTVSFSDFKGKLCIFVTLFMFSAVVSHTHGLISGSQDIFYHIRHHLFGRLPVHTHIMSPTLLSRRVGSP
jgi:hypothetical protein